MSNKVVTRRELLDRWRAIEEEDDDETDYLDHSKQRHIRHLKETWFSDAFNFLTYLPREIHIWCGSWDIMGPLLETFYNYFKGDRLDSPLKLLWKRISDELQDCMQCICQHHQAKDTYTMEYELSSIGPLLDVLCMLDEERVTSQLKEMNAIIARGEYDPVKHNAKVISVMYEVLMFPVLLDDQSLVTEFQIFIEAVDDSHELTLAGHQQYPGVYALLFLKSRRCRSIGFRLAGHMGKLRTAADLDPLQPLLKKCILILETEVVPLNSERSRPRMQLDRITVWLGIKALLGFLEPHAFEEGILERYPSFLSVVLNHISDDSLEFSYAINCLRLLFEMLGCKLWLRAALSPTVMRDTLLGQCFHTRDEKSHKEMFDLFPPFLQSLEALQDGEHKKQRRHFLYFLLHQVPVSSNFSALMRKKACQIALLIIHRGYKMNPCCPPFECAHMWGPSLVATLKDSSLYNSLRQPAFDLIQTIIVSDATALVSSILHHQAHDRNNADFQDQDDNEDLFTNDVEEKDVSCWDEFSVQSHITSQEFGVWMCIPMLWFDVLVEIDPVVLPVSFSKAVLWALSRFSMVEPEISTEMALPVGQWLATRVTEVSHFFGWRTPSGSDDGGNRDESKNSVNVATMYIPLIRTFRRLTTHFVVKMEQGELRKQWTWEPRMGESLILLLVDPDDNARQVGRRILEQVANTRGLLSCLQFLCSCSASISAVFLGLRHALQLLLVDSVLQRFQNLHHFFFVLYKLLKEGVPSGEFQSGMLYGDQSIIKFSSEGGFLHQPIFDTVATTIDGNSSMYWKKFSCLLSEIAWPSFCKCLAEAKAFIDYKNSQMTCIRMLEILPVVLRRLQQPMHRVSGNSGIVVAYSVDYKWLHDLMYWGKSSLAVVVRYWKQTVLSLLDLLKESCKDNTSAVMAIEKLIHCDNIPIDELTEQVWCLSVSSKSDINEPSNACGNTKFKELLLQSEGLVHKGKCTAKKPATFPSKDSDVQILDSAIDDRTEETVIILSDDEMDVKAQAVVVNLSHAASGHSSVDGEAVCSQTAEISSQNDIASNKAFAGETSVKQLEYLHRTDSPDTAGLVDQKLPVKRDVEKARILSVPQPKSLHGPKTEKSSEAQKKSYLKQSSAGNMSSKIVNSIPCQHASSLEVSEEIVASQKVDDQGIKKASAKSDKVIKELIFDAKDDPWEFALKSAKHQQSHLAKLNIGGPKGPKRHVIQLNLPVENRSSQLNRLGGGHQRFKPLRLDEWFKPILEMDYFASVGLASVVEKNQASKELKKVPVHFQSPDDYAAIFRPLVLEEFKAQLHNSFMEMASPEDMSCGSLSILSVERVDDFHVVRGLHDDSDVEGSKSCTENDIVLLTRQPLKNSSHDVHMVGKVERREKDGKRRSSILVIKFYLQNGCSRLNRAKKLLMERSKWQIHHIMNITPQLREFQALSSINTIPLLPTILNPSNQPTVLESRMDMSKLSQPMQQNIKLSFNDSQLQAISTVTRSMDLRNDYDLFLIQGPPGTGKTRTIVAIVSVLLSLSGISSGRRPENGVNRPSNSSFMRKVQASQSAAIARAWQDAALAKQLKDSEGKDCKATASHARGRVLICAQSNAAVDELVSRISSHGLYGSDGLMYKPYLVRVGNAKTVHPSSLPFFIDTLVDNRLMEERINAGDAKSDVNLDTVTVLRSKLEKLVDRIRFFEAKRANLCNGNPNFNQFLEGDAAKSDDVKETSDSEIGAKLRKLYSDKKAVYIDLTNAQALEKKANEERKALKHKLRKTILREAEIVITTLSGCGGDLYAVCSESMLSHKFSSSSESSLFDAVVIDEAAQALEPASLIPLQLLKSKGSKSIMVGDPKQLPATVLSGVASKYLYQCSMFERLQKAGHPVTMLTKQYRMHPEICRFPSLHFYDGNLLNGEQMSCKETSFHKTEGLGPYLFFDIVDGQELHGKNSGSLCNEFEADAAVELLKFFRKSYPSEFGGRSIGIITPYRSQLSLLRSRFSVAFGSSIMDEMELNTVDGFQGREVDILVLSTVRASEQSFRTTKINSSNIGFLADVRRMNVALTRAKHSLWILGNVKTLQTNENWGSLIKDAKERNLVFSVKRPYIFMNTNFKCDRVSENLHGISGQRNPKKRKNKVSRDAEPQKHSSSSDRERGSPGAHSNHSIGVDKNASLATRDVDITKKKARKLYDSSAKKDHGSFNRACKDVKSAITEDNEGQLLTRNIDLDKPSDRTLQEKGGRSSSQVEKTKDSICKRKKQREAVDALLPSAFISSKKNESSLKPVHNRTSHPPLRPSVHDAIRSTKPGKGKSVLVKRNSSNSRGTE